MRWGIWGSLTWTCRLRRVAYGGSLTMRAPRKLPNSTLSRDGPPFTGAPSMPIASTRASAHLIRAILAQVGAGCGRVSSGEFLCDDFPNCRPLGHATSVIDDPWQIGGVHAVSFQPIRQSEEVRIANRIGVAHYPRLVEHGTLDEAETRTNGLRHLALHLRDGERVVCPSMAAHAMSVGHVQR